MKNGYEIAKVPTEGKWFEVKPLSIDQELFEGERKNKSQEETRQLILEAFEEMSKHPEKYTKKFRTMMPKKEQKEEWITVEKLKKMARELGDHNANWVEQALEWAQRIANGESWEQLCNKCDTANWYRIVVWKSGNVRLVGGSVCYVNHSIARATSISLEEFDNYREFQFAVPLVVSYEE